MKKYLFLIGVACVALLSSCVKEKNCRCSVLGSMDTRIITITQGDCSKLNYVTYYDALDSAHVDPVVCTDYPFIGDSSIIYQK